MRGISCCPDGNGAAIDFNTPRTGAVEYAAEVYGRDPSLKQQQKGAVAQPVSLPFLGIRRGQDALLAIAAEGGELATIKAAASGMSTQWNSAYFTFRYRETDNITLNEMSWSERVLPYLGEVNGDVEAFTVLYSFLPMGQADEAAWRPRQAVPDAGVRDGSAGNGKRPAVYRFVHVRGAHQGDAGAALQRHGGADLLRPGHPGCWTRYGASTKAGWWCG